MRYILIILLSLAIFAASLFTMYAVRRFLSFGFLGIVAFIFVFAVGSLLLWKFTNIFSIKRG
jgi:hypothetical protein